MKIFLAEVMQFCSSKKIFRPLRTPPGRNFCTKISANLRFLAENGHFLALVALQSTPGAQNRSKMYFMTLNDPNKQSRSIPSMCTHQAHPSWGRNFCICPPQGQFLPKISNFLKTCTNLRKHSRMVSNSFLGLNRLW